MTDTLFDTPDKGNEEIELIDNSYVKTLVGDDRKYKDEEALAKATLEAQKHIARIEAENAQLREETNKSKTVEELLARQEQMFKKPETDPNMSIDPKNDLENRQEKPTGTLTQEQVEKMLESRLAEREQEIKQQSNLSSVMEFVKSTYSGNEAMVWEDMKQKSGLSEQEARQLAQSNPGVIKGLLSGAEVKQAPKSNPSLFGNNVDPSKQTMNTPPQGDAKPDSYYKELKKNQKGILTPQQANKRIQDRIALGDSYWK